MAQTVPSLGSFNAPQLRAPDFSDTARLLDLAAKFQTQGNTQMTDSLQGGIDAAKDSALRSFLASTQDLSIDDRLNAARNAGGFVDPEQAITKIQDAFKFDTVRNEEKRRGLAAEDLLATNLASRENLVRDDLRAEDAAQLARDTFGLAQNNAQLARDKFGIAQNKELREADEFNFNKINRQTVLDRETTLFNKKVKLSDLETRKVNQDLDKEDKRLKDIETNNAHFQIIQNVNENVNDPILASNNTIAAFNNAFNVNLDNGVNSDRLRTEYNSFIANQLVDISENTLATQGIIKSDGKTDYSPAAKARLKKALVSQLRDKYGKNVKRDVLENAADGAIERDTILTANFKEAALQAGKTDKERTSIKLTQNMETELARINQLSGLKFTEAYSQFLVPLRSLPLTAEQVELRDRGRAQAISGITVDLRQTVAATKPENEVISPSDITAIDALIAAKTREKFPGATSTELASIGKRSKEAVPGLPSKIAAAKVLNIKKIKAEEITQDAEITAKTAGPVAQATAKAKKEAFIKDIDENGHASVAVTKELTSFFDPISEPDDLLHRKSLSRDIGRVSSLIKKHGGPRTPGEIAFATKQFLLSGAVESGDAFFGNAGRTELQVDTDDDGRQDQEVNDIKDAVLFELIAKQAKKEGDTSFDEALKKFKKKNSVKKPSRIERTIEQLIELQKIGQ